PSAAAPITEPPWGTAEQKDIVERRWSLAAIHRDERVVAPQSGMVKEPGQEALAGSAFDQNRWHAPLRILTRYQPTCLVARGTDLLAISDQPVEQVSHGASSSHGHLERVEAPGEAIDGVDDLALVDEDIVDLDGAGLRAARRIRHE